MQCKNCGTETNGLKINLNLYCPNCGEKIASAVPQAPIDKEVAEGQNTVPEAKRITSDGTEKLKREIDLLEAEEEVLDVLESEKEKKPNDTPKEAPVKIVSVPKRSKLRTIIKHGRERVGYRHEKEFLLVPNEPDPIAEPEIEPPSSVGGEGSIVHREDGVAKEQKKNHHDILATFLREGVSNVSQKKKQEVKKKGKRKIILAILIPVFLLLGFTGLVLYANMYGIKAEPAVRKAEDTASFGFVRPKYVPLGYELTYLTSGTSDSIDYDYKYLPDESKKLNIKISKSDLKGDEELEAMVVGDSSTYLVKTQGDTKYFLADDKKLYFLSSSNLYEIISSHEIAKEELFKIADGLR